MRWLAYGLIILLIGAVVYQFLLNKKGGLQVSPQTVLTGQVKQAPGFEGGVNWIGTDPLELKALLADNKLVLVDFWTYTCINCQRTFPYLKDWWSKYKDKGLVIVGVHAPEFEFEKRTENVEAAMEKYGLSWPVVQDNDFKIWRAYDNHYWPAKYLVVPSGEVIYSHFGEGEYEATEKIIRSQLEKLGYDLAGTQVGQEGEASSARGQSPETYLGYARGRYGSGSQIEMNTTKVYEEQGGRMANLVYLVGEWTITDEYARAGVGASLSYKFNAGEVNLVMRLTDEMEGSKKVRVFIDGRETKTVEITGDDLYNMYKGEMKQAELRLAVDEGVELYAFTFGK